MKVTAQEIVELIEGLVESDTLMGSISDKQVIMALELVSRIKSHGIVTEPKGEGTTAKESKDSVAIAPPDGMVLVAEIVKNDAGQIRLVDAQGNSFDMSKFIGVKLYSAPEVKP